MNFKQMFAFIFFRQTVNLKPFYLLIIQTHLYAHTHPSQTYNPSNPPLHNRIHTWIDPTQTHTISTSHKP